MLGCRLSGWVIPVGGSWRLMRGGIYRWTIRIEQKCALWEVAETEDAMDGHGWPWMAMDAMIKRWI